MVDLDVWLRSLAAQLSRIEAALPETFRRAGRGTAQADVAGPASRPGGQGS
ncbi:hypothetical protein ACIHCM_17530 [Streptomyces sp. NPDC052023]|uniref:hypothetical protein n=1 Tax=Streptomyces sp. NPDC052023 TaxID=3365681 RepID=UPI0037D0F9B3